MAIDADFWARRRVLITGHTGFKGAWLSLWLQSLGADVSGLAPGAPTRPSLYELARVGANVSEYSVDVCDAGAVREALAQARPEVVLHMAAQPARPTRSLPAGDGDRAAVVSRGHRSAPAPARRRGHSGRAGRERARTPRP